MLEFDSEIHQKPSKDEFLQPDTLCNPKTFQHHRVHGTKMESLDQFVQILRSDYSFLAGFLKESVVGKTFMYGVIS